MTGISALLLFAVWTLLLMLLYAGYRVVLVFAMKKKANSWTHGQATDNPAFVTLASHARMNCVENLPVYAVIVLAAAVIGKSPVVESVACVFT